MHIILDSLRKFHDCGDSFELPSNISRFIEFEKVVVFLLDENGKRDKIIGVKFSQAGGINHYYIDWEFQIIDGLEDVHKIAIMTREILNNQDLIYCYGLGFDIGYYLDPETGQILHIEPIK